MRRIDFDRILDPASNRPENVERHALEFLSSYKQRYGDGILSPVTSAFGAGSDEFRPGYRLRVFYFPPGLDLAWLILDLRREQVPEEEAREKIDSKVSTYGQERIYGIKHSRDWDLCPKVPEIQSIELTKGRRTFNPCSKEDGHFSFFHAAFILSWWNTYCRFAFDPDIENPFEGVQMNLVFEERTVSFEWQLPSDR